MTVMIRRDRFIIIFLIALLCGVATSVASTNDTIPEMNRGRDDSVMMSVMEVDEKPKKSRIASMLTARVSYGKVFETNDFLRDYNINQYKTASIKFAIASLGNRWQDIAYGMPYYGIGVQIIDFGNYKKLGRPFSLFLVQGANLAKITSKLHFNFELNLGVSIGWKHYDAFANPDNVAVGSAVNIHAGLIGYFKWIASRDLDINFGVEVGHFSNGASRKPNKGINIGGVFVEASYNFNRKYVYREYTPDLIPPKHDPYWVSEFLINVSSRQQEATNKDDLRPTNYVDKTFTVLGFSYATLRTPNYRYRYGISTDLIYDESAGVTSTREINPHDGRWYDRVEKGRIRERFSLGISARGEIVYPGYSIFANMGISIIHGNKREHRFYQVIALKVYLKDNLFGTFGIRATHFSKAQFLYWSLGYTLKHSPFVGRRVDKKR